MTTLQTRDEQDQRWKDLMVKSHRGDQQAYGELLRELGVVIERFCKSRLPGPGDWEDAVQESLLAIHLARHTYDPVRPFRPWMFGIVRHKIIDALRMKMKLMQREALLNEDAVVKTAVSEPGAQDMSEDLCRAIASLPAVQRQAIELLKVQGLTVREAAQRAGVSESALKVRAHRGYNALRKKMERVGHGDS